MDKLGDETAVRGNSKLYILTKVHVKTNTRSFLVVIVEKYVILQ
jgi:hypothetical protein